MKNNFIAIVVIAAFVSWWGMLIYFGNVSNPHPGSWQFLLGSVFTAVFSFGLTVLFSKEK
jgi:hypothetical protein